MGSIFLDTKLHISVSKIITLITNTYIAVDSPATLCSSHNNQQRKMSLLFYQAIGLSPFHKEQIWMEFGYMRLKIEIYTSFKFAENPSTKLSEFESQLIFLRLYFIFSRSNKNSCQFQAPSLQIYHRI